MPLQRVMKISQRQILIFKKPGFNLGNSIAKIKARAVISKVKRKGKEKTKKWRKKAKKFDHLLTLLIEERKMKMSIRQSLKSSVILN